ncbi:MAG: isopenicillin N synthase family oxygenase [Rhodospirillales bacterium]|jgi:isopenicillin N synthase-like dioxygenase|nr:isopenicillin N synthase family oxygenase [Rhodospirillales bacterium]MBT4041154.1 isopenicillin N synthase family oxygenase [Rhodospirillales bacterium]MBT4627200.1 isopenicillin N synthase family oxygenase [Rhodospirillales bacterium]MBT5351924.1 isopenicillin N synthase family oxygenase [Rhodospirillales bacterium]MBT5522391.1 isopenicillin N synthase family oxygenase [Rhodospirillales bacterium]
MSIHTITNQSVSEIAEEFKGIRVPFESIPIIDLAAFRDGSARRDVADSMARAARDVGFFYVTNHGVDEAVVDEALEQTRQFFNQPLEIKSRYPIADSFPHQRGYVPVFGEELGMDETVDLKESFDLGVDLPADDPDVVAGIPFYSPNTWPDHMPDFKVAITTYYDGMLELSKVLGHAFAMSLGLDEDFFVDRMKKPIANMRLLHYPPYSPVSGQKVIGAGAHSDYGFVTILVQDQIGGLQVQNMRGEWIEAPPIPGALVINIGEMLAMWTNDLFVATRHRVMNISGVDRYSIPLFLDMDYDVEVSCLPTCLGDDGHPKYQPVRAGDYISKRLNETFPFRRDQVS